MAQTWHCEQGDGEPSVVVLSSLEDGQATGAVSTPCIAHWVGLCAAVVEAAGGAITWPQPDTPSGLEESSDVGLGIVDPRGAPDDDQADDDDEAPPEPGPPDPMVTRVVRRGQTRSRSKAERGAMHSHLREAESGTESG